jgi:hypothetical protein
VATSQADPGPWWTREAWRYRAGYALVVALLLAVTVTHLGNDSPYTYGYAVFGNPRPCAIEGQPVNADALSVVPLTTGFLEPCGLAYDTPNIFLPLHSLVVASVIAFTHSYMLSQWLVSFASVALLLAALFRIGRERAIPPAALTLAAASILLLPPVAHYAGQPLQYAFGVSVDCLLVMAVVRQSEHEEPDPWLAGVAIALMSLTYDWYVFAGGVVLYLLLFRRFARRRDYAKMLVAGLAPMILWGRFLAWAARGHLNDRVTREIAAPLKEAWTFFLTQPPSRAANYLTLGHIALDVMVKSLMGMIWWPTLVVVAALVIWRRAPALQTAWGRMGLCLASVYAAEQLLIAAAVLNNPRRAFPAVFAFCVALVWAIAATWRSARGRALFATLALVSGMLVFADTACNDPTPAMMATQEMLATPPKEPLLLKEVHLDQQPRALMAAETRLPVGRFAPVCGQVYDPAWVALEDKLPVKLGIDPPDVAGLSPRRVLLEFGVSLALLVAAAAGAAWVFVRARLASRTAALGGVALVVLSLVARVFY